MTEAEGRASVALEARNEAVAAAARGKEAADEVLRSCQEEAETARALVKQVGVCVLLSKHIYL